MVALMDVVMIIKYDLFLVRIDPRCLAGPKFPSGS